MTVPSSTSPPDIKTLMRVAVSKDRLKASLHFCPRAAPKGTQAADDGPLKPSSDEALSAARGVLADGGVSFGIDEGALKNAVSTWAEGGEEAEIEVASGLAPVDGADASIELFSVPVQKSASSGEALAVDHRVRSTITNVAAGTRLARLVPATEGTPGRSVDGGEIAAKPGVAIEVKTNALVSEAPLEDGSILYCAEADGMIDRHTKSEILVTKTKEIDGDVSYDTGNIDAWGEITIKGSVKPNFAVSARSNVKIRGGVESAEVSSGGDVATDGGLFGKVGSTRVTAKGGVRCLFMEHASVKAGGNVKVADSVVDSEIECKGSVEVLGRRGIILTSTVRATGGIVANIAGSCAEGPVLLVLGNDPRMWRRVNRLKKEISYLKYVVNKTLARGSFMRETGFQRRIRIRRTDQRKIAIIMERSIKRRIKGVLVSFAQMGIIPAVVIRKETFPNVTIKIGPYSRTLSDMNTGGIFALDPESERIMAIK